MDYAVRAALAKQAAEMDLLRQRNEALSSEVGLLKERITELKASLWRWRLIALLLGAVPNEICARRRAAGLDARANLLAEPILSCKFLLQLGLRTQRGR